MTCRKMAMMVMVIVASAGSGQASFVTLDPTSSLACQVTNAASVNPIKNYGVSPGLVTFEGRSASYVTSVYKFDLASLVSPDGPGTGIVAASLVFDVRSTQTIFGPTVSLIVRGFGSATVTTTVDDFAAFPFGDPVTLPLNLSTTRTIALDRFAMIAGLIGRQDAGFEFSCGGNGNVSFNRPQLIVTFGSVPEPPGFVIIGTGMGLVGLYGLIQRTKP